MNIIDLFCGTGGLSYGMSMAIPGAKAIYGIDILKNSIGTFKANHPNAITDINDIRAIHLPDLHKRLGRKSIDVIVGGPPCQGFSSIRPFRGSGLDDPRNSLFEQFANFVNYFTPEYFVFENVVGLATHNNGDTINKINDVFQSIGYNADWKILNSAHFGIPQKRERLILMGRRSGQIQWPLPTHLCPFDTIGHVDKSRMLVPLEQPTIFNDAIATDKCVTLWESISDLPSIKSGESSGTYAVNPLNSYQKLMRSGFHKELTLHQATKHSEKMLEIIKHSGPNISFIPKSLISSGFSSCYSRLSPNEPSVTLTVNFVHPASNRCIHPYDNRALTVREGARIQSFPDSFVFNGSRTSIVKQIGNAVPPLLGYRIAESIFGKKVFAA